MSLFARGAARSLNFWSASRRRIIRKPALRAVASSPIARFRPSQWAGRPQAAEHYLPYQSVVRSLERVPAKQTVCLHTWNCSEGEYSKMQLESSDAKDTFKTRLRRVEGQMRGVQKMVDDDRDCQEIIQQLSAIRSAVQNASEFFLLTYAKECLTRAGYGDTNEELIDDVMRLMVKIR